MKNIPDFNEFINKEISDPINEDLMVFFTEKESHIRNLTTYKEEIEYQVKRSQFIKKTPKFKELSKKAVDAIDALIKATNDYNPHKD